MRILRLEVRYGRWILTALVLSALILVPIESSTGAPRSSLGGPGGIGIRLLDAPAEASDDPRAQLYIVDHLTPGSVITRRIEVSNTTQEPQSVAVYPAAASIDDDRFVGADGHTANDLSKWTTVLPTSVDLQPGGTETVVVTIAVPEDAESGERYAVVWAEVRSGDTSGIVQVNRVGIRLYVSVGVGAAPAADFTIESLTAQRSSDGMPTVIATVRNTGGRALDLAGSLELLDGPGGLSAGPFPATLGSTLAVGSTGQVVIELDERVPNGPWSAELTLRSGLLERSAKASITFPEVGSAAPVSTTGWQSRQLIIGGCLAFGLLLCAVIAVFVLRRRSSHRTTA